MKFLPNNELDNNPSNWWMPNEKCLIEMLKACDFHQIQKTWESDINIDGLKVVCYSAVPNNNLPYKIHPRRNDLMK